jgi:hypothetical protein
MYTDGPEMNFRTESFDFPQKEQRRWRSLDIGVLVRVLWREYAERPRRESSAH